MENGAEVRRLAKSRDGRAEQAGLLARRQEGPDGGVDLTHIAPKIDGNRHRHCAPAVDLLKAGP
jgi:hypothetical protein